MRASGTPAVRARVIYVAMLWGTLVVIGVLVGLRHVTGDVLLFALAGGWAVAMFLAYAPGRLSEG